MSIDTHETKPRVVRVAAVQTPPADSVASGLDRATPLVARAAADGAELVLLPELMAVNYRFTSEMWDCAETEKGTTVQWLRDTASHLQLYLGTSFLEACGDDFFNTFVLVTPEGEVAGRVRKQTPALLEPWFFRGEAGPHVIKTALGRIGVGVCNDNHRSYLPRLLQKEDADLVLMPHCWPLPARAGGVVSQGDLDRWHELQSSLASLYARILGIPAVFTNKVGPYSSPSPVWWLPRSTDMRLPGHASIADSDGTIKARLADDQGVITAPVTLDPGRKIRTPPRTYGRYVYPAGVAGVIVLAPAWVGSQYYRFSGSRRQRARLTRAGARPAAPPLAAGRN